ncbi:MAG: alpha/beta fold hydrolase [Acidimicrobiales bacterium]
MTNRRVPTIVVCCLLVTACSSGGGKITLGKRVTSGSTAPTSNSTPTTGQTIAWGTCRDVEIAVTDEVASAARSAGMQCGTLAVPVDRDSSDGRTIDLAVARIPAKGSAGKRIGSLIVNPGGPGGSGLEFLASSAEGLPADWRQRFDIVSFDPRGIAASAPLDCLTQSQRAKIVDAEPSTDPATAQADAAREEQEIADGCAKDDDELFRNLGTDEVAGDLDDLRAAVGDERLTFLGLSYGTRIAAAYATKYPDRVRAVVLDGSVTPSRDLVDSSSGQVKGISRALEAFVTRCNADTTCPLAPDAMGRMNALAATLKATPFTITPASGGSTGSEQLTKEKYVTGVVTALYDPSVSMALAEAVDALQGDDSSRAQEGAAFLSDLAGRQSSKQPDGTYGNGYETQSVVNCLDADGPLETGELAKVRELAGPIPPLLDTDPATDTPSCVTLPTGDGLAISATTATPHLLIVGTQGDPATPIEWTGQMRTALGDPTLITYGGSGHTASLSRSCVTAQVTKFLVDGTLASAQNCPADPSESDIYAQIAQQFETMGLSAAVGSCIADAIRQKIDPLAVVGLDGANPDPKIVSILQQAAMSCR